MAVFISSEPFERLIVSLRNDGLLKEADLLDQMIHKVAWTTGSELIGELGLSIEKIRKENIDRLSADSIKNIKESMKLVKRVCPGFSIWREPNKTLRSIAARSAAWARLIDHKLRRDIRKIIRR